jgi:hypothetical protein
MSTDAGDVPATHGRRFDAPGSGSSPVVSGALTRRDDALIGHADEPEAARCYELNLKKS